VQVSGGGGGVVSLGFGLLTWVFPPELPLSQLLVDPWISIAEPSISESHVVAPLPPKVVNSENASITVIFTS
jgi:hypothetical protein